MRGGWRPNSGLPKGYRFKKTLDKEAARAEARKFILANLEPMLRAQIAHATGIGHMYTRDKNGKYTKVESQERVDELMRDGVEGNHYFIFTKDPSAVAFKELLDRALDRPKEQAQEIHISGEIELTARLTQARSRSHKVIDVEISRRSPELLVGGTAPPDPVVSRDTKISEPR